MKVNKLVKSIFSFGLILILFVTLPVFEQKTYAAEIGAMLNVGSQPVVIGRTFKLKVYNLTEDQTVTYRSSTPSVASVDANGTILGVSNGYATVYAIVKENGKVVSNLHCSIYVGPAAHTIWLKKSKVDMQVGEKYLLEKVIMPTSTAEVPRFVSNDPTVVSVSAGGKLTGKSVGSTYVFCMLESGAFAPCKVNVYDNSTEETVEEIVIPATDETANTETGNETVNDKAEN